MSDLQIFLILSGIVLITLLTGYVLFTPRKQPRATDGESEAQVEQT